MGNVPAWHFELVSGTHPPSYSDRLGGPSTESCNGPAATGGGGVLGNRISCLNPPPEPNLKKGGGFGGFFKGFFAARGYSPLEGHPGPPKPPQ